MSRYQFPSAAITDASLLVSGTLADARLSSNVALENVANVFTAKQSFSGTTHVGLCLHSLTTSEYNALTPANGDLFRDSTTDRIDARLARGTVELVDTAGGQTIGDLKVTNLLDLRKTGTANLIQFATNTSLRTDTSQLSIYDSGLGRSNISLWRSDNFVVGSSTLIAACSNLDSTGGSVDTSMSRASAGVWQMGTTTNNALGSLNLTNLTASGTVIANAVQLAGVDLYAALMTNLRITDMAWTTGTVTGSASTGPQGSTTSTNRIDNQTGTTAGSTFVRSLGIWGGTDGAAFYETLAYSRPVGFLCSLYRTSTSTNSIARFLIANQTGATALASPGFGFEIRNERIWMVAHDGSALTQFDTGVSWYTGAVNLMRCESNGSGTISLFRGGTLLGTVSGAPTGAFPGFISVSGTNGADASSLRFQYNRIIYVRV